MRDTAEGECDQHADTFGSQHDAGHLGASARHRLRQLVADGSWAEFSIGHQTLRDTLP